MNSYISKVLAALRHHDTPRHLRRGELLQSQKMDKKWRGGPLEATCLGAVVSNAEALDWLSSGASNYKGR
jgi:hypothetical protein